MTTTARRAARAALASAVALGVAAAGSGTAANAETEWRILHGGQSLGGSFGAVAAADADHIWAFGDDQAQSDGATWVYGWDGRQWTREDLPEQWSLVPEVADASAPDNVWAAGRGADRQAGTLRYDGEEWRTFDLDPALWPNDIAAVAPDDVWLLGGIPGDPPRAARFDGEIWRDYSAPRVGGALSALDSGDIIAVGEADDRPAVDRWNGEEWVPMAAPEVDVPPGESGAALTDVLARADDDIWAVGHIHYKDPDDVAHRKPILAHWDGTEWDTTVEESDTGYDVVVDDGAGGVWIRESHWNPTYLHRAADGAVTRHTVDGGEYDLAVFGMAHVPGTHRVVAAGTAFEKGDPDEFHDYGVILGHGF